MYSLNTQGVKLDEHLIGDPRNAKTEPNTDFILGGKSSREAAASQVQWYVNNYEIQCRSFPTATFDIASTSTLPRKPMGRTFWPHYAYRQSCRSACSDHTYRVSSMCRRPGNKAMVCG